MLECPQFCSLSTNVEKLFFEFSPGPDSFLGIIPLTPELNPSAQRCLTRCFTGDFAS
jgi:hypothetical protein